MLKLYAGSEFLIIYYKNQLLKLKLLLSNKSQRIKGNFINRSQNYK